MPGFSISTLRFQQPLFLPAPRRATHPVAVRAGDHRRRQTDGEEGEEGDARRVVDGDAELVVVAALVVGALFGMDSVLSVSVRLHV